MSDQADNKNVIINKTLRTLVQQNGLTPEEISQLRLSHLHLAGKSPSISFTLAGQPEPKVVALDMDTHRALVSWLVNRPDSTGDFLFPGSNNEAMTVDEIRHAIEQAESMPSTAGTAPDLPKPSAPPETPLSAAEPPAGTASRPVRPLSRPEMGTPPPGVAPAGEVFMPPPTAPEEEASLNIPLPTSAPPPARPASPPRPPSGPISRPEPPPPSVNAASAAAPVSTSSEATLAGAKKPEPKKEDTQAAPVSEKGAEQTLAAPAKKESKAVPVVGAKKVEPPLAAQKARTTFQPPAQRRSGMPRALLPVIIGLVVLCAACLGGAWFVGQTESGSQFLASLGWSGGTTAGTTEPTAETGEAVTFESAVPTPTLPSTATPTSLPPTNTPPPTDTATPTPILDTPTPEVTNTPTPTETSEPTDTPEAEEEEIAPATPTPGLKYGPLELVEPKDGFAFIRGNTIVLKWKPVDLAPDEQYAVRLVYIYQGQPTYQGANIKEPEWTVPLELFGQIDGPENRYEWFVVVERLNDDGSGTAVSPESPHRAFNWK